MRHSGYLLACVLSLACSTVFATENVAQTLLAEGDAYFTGGQINQALNSFDAAIRADPGNYLSYFKRATAYLSLGRNNAAVEDFSTILNLKPDFDHVLVHRARIYLKEGILQWAIQDLENYTSKHNGDKEATKMLGDAKTAESALKLAQEEKEKGDYDSCITHATTVSRISPLLISARLLRAQCSLGAGYADQTAGDITRIIQLKPTDAETLMLLSRLEFYAFDHLESGLDLIKKCLKYDPSHKQCRIVYGRVKRLHDDFAQVKKDMNKKKYAAAVNRLIGTRRYQGILDNVELDVATLEKDLKCKGKLPKETYYHIYQLACKIYREQHEVKKIEKWCSLALGVHSDDVESLQYRAELYIEREDYSAAVKDLKLANKLAEGRNAEIARLLKEAQQALKALKQSKRLDYYKLLDVSRNADKSEIKKAYRKKAHQWHPDKYKGDLDKDQVEKKMAEINQAYEVLSDPDMRQEYDSGFDPYDPDRGSGGNPFAAGGQQQQYGFNWDKEFPFNFPGQHPFFKMQF